MKSVLRMMAVIGMAAGLIGGPVAVAQAHPWRCNGNTPYHWAYSGNGDLSISTEYKGLQPKKPAKKAANDLMAKVPFIKLVASSGGAQMTIVDGNEGDKGWAGLAVVKPNADCEIQHADVILNTFYGTSPSLVQGIYCQEIGHSFGLDHSDDGSCMGLGYFRSGTSSYSSHNVSDIKASYSGGSAQLPSNKRFANRGTPPPFVTAVWGFSPDSIGEAEGEAETVVTAKAVASNPGAPITTEDGIAIPTTETTLEVDTAYKGEALPGEEVVVQQIGGGGVFASEDPAYRPGQEYLLMLNPNDEGNVSHIVSPDSRYSLRADGTLTATMETSVSAAVTGQSLNALTGSLGLQPIKASKREFGGEGLTRILIIVGIAIAALVALAVIARFALGRR